MRTKRFCWRRIAGRLKPLRYQLKNGTRLTFTKKPSFLAAATIGVLSINAAVADSVVRVEKLHPSANRSYKVAGKRYTPLTQVSSFSQTGKASWYWQTSSTAVKLPAASVTI